MAWEVLGSAGLGAAASILGSRTANSANRAATDRETMTNLYEGAQNRQWNSQEAALARDWNAQQAAMSRDWSAQQAALTREFDSYEAGAARQWASGEAGIARGFNRAEAEAQRSWSGGQADKQMAFQERMRGTQYQTAMADMRAAGLNPMLAYSQGGAGTPIGASGQGHSASASAPGGYSAHGSNPSGATASGSAASGAPAHAGRPMPYVMPDIPSLMSTALQFAQLDVAKSQADNIKADTANKQAEQLDPTGKEGPKTYSVLEKQSRAQHLQSEIRLNVERAGLTEAETRMVEQNVRNAIETGHKIRADTDNAKANTVLRTLEVNEAKASSKYWGENPENYMFSHIIKMIGEAVGSAVGLKRIFR